MAEIINAFINFCEIIAQAITWVAGNFGVWVAAAAFILICREAHKR